MREEDLTKLGGSYLILARLMDEIRSEAVKLSATLENIQAENVRQTAAIVDLAAATRELKPIDTVSGTP